MNSSSPRILYLCSSWPLGRTFGGQLRALQIGRALKQVGDVTVAVVSSDADDTEAEHRTREEFAVLPPVCPVSLPNRTVINKLRRALDPKYLNVHGYVAASKDAERIVSYFPEYDLVWVYNSRTPNILLHWRWPHAHLDLDDVPSTYLVGVSQSAATVRERWKADVLRFLWRRREILFKERFTTVSVCSEGDRLYLGGGDQVHVIPNGFERPVGEPPRHPVTTPPWIGFMGLYTYEPNLDGVRWFLKECWPAIRQEVPGVRFRLVGKGSDGPLRPTDPDVDVLGWVGDPADEIANWSATIIPIRFGGGTRVKIADAFSRKCPIVSTRLGALGYDVQHGRELLVVDDNDPGAFASACISSIRDPVMANARAERAHRAFLEKWTWDAIAPKVWAAAEDCLRRSYKSQKLQGILSAADPGGTLTNQGRHAPMAVSSPGSPSGMQPDFGRTPSANESMMILLATHNRSRVLSQTLNAFVQTDRTGIDLEIVVVDNNCTDDTTECVAKFRDQLPLILLKEPKEGKNCALNKALRERPLRDLVVFVDDDITPNADWLQQIVGASRRWPDISVFGSKVTVGWPLGRQPDWVVADWVKVLGFAWHDLGDQEKAYPANSTPMGGCLWVRKEVFSKVSSMDETIGPRPTNRIMGGEVSFLLSLERHGFKMVYSPAVSVEHRIQPEGCSLRVLERRAYRSGRGDIRLYGIHRAPLFKKSRQLWNLAMLADLCFYAGSRFLGSFLVPNKRKHVELILRAAVRAGKITESWRVVRAAAALLLLNP